MKNKKNETRLPFTLLFKEEISKEMEAEFNGVRIEMTTWETLEDPDP